MKRNQRLRQVDAGRAGSDRCPPGQTVRGFARHLREVVRVPVGLHHACLGVTGDSLEKVCDLMRHHVGQESGYLGGSIGTILDEVIQHDNVNCFIGLCVCHGARVLAWRRVGGEIENDGFRLLELLTDGRCSGVPFECDPGSCEHPRGNRFRAGQDEGGSIGAGLTQTQTFGAGSSLLAQMPATGIRTAPSIQMRHAPLVYCILPSPERTQALHRLQAT